jgi:hypothetical protein
MAYRRKTAFGTGAVPPRLPCPFCRSPYTDMCDYKSPTHPHYHKFWIRCPGCKACGPYGDDKEDAADRWNSAPRVRAQNVGPPVPLDFTDPQFDR